MIQGSGRCPEGAGTKGAQTASANESSARTRVVIRKRRGLAIPAEPFPKRVSYDGIRVDGDLSMVPGFGSLLQRRSYPLDVLFIPPKHHILEFRESG